jgi:stage V sporulation protein SpoVS
MHTNLPLLDNADKDIKVIQVAARTLPKGLALSITEEVRKALRPEAGEPKPPQVSLHAMGNEAVGVAVKALAIANGHVATMGLVLLLHPSFEDRPMPSNDGKEEMVTRTIVRMRIVGWRVGGW